MIFFKIVSFLFADKNSFIFEEYFLQENAQGFLNIQKFFSLLTKKKLEENSSRYSFYEEGYQLPKEVINYKTHLDFYLKILKIVKDIDKYEDEQQLVEVKLPKSFNSRSFDFYEYNYDEMNSSFKEILTFIDWKNLDYSETFFNYFIVDYVQTEYANPSPKKAFGIFHEKEYNKLVKSLVIPREFFINENLAKIEDPSVTYRCAPNPYCDFPATYLLFTEGVEDIFLRLNKGYYEKWSPLGQQRMKALVIALGYIYPKLKTLHVLDMDFFKSLKRDLQQYTAHNDFKERIKNIPFKAKRYQLSEIEKN